MGGTRWVLPGQPPHKQGGSRFLTTAFMEKSLELSRAAGKTQVSKRMSCEAVLSLSREGIRACAGDLAAVAGLPQDPVTTAAAVKV